MKKGALASLKRKLAGILASVVCVTALATVMPTTATVAEAATKTFVHPGMLHTAVGLEKIRQNVANKVQPNLDTWNVLLTDGYSSLTENPRPLETVVRGGTGSNYAQFYKDVRRAYQLALVWSINGDEAYGERACEYLNSWSSTMTSLTGNADRFLAAGIYGYELANAAELMRNHPSFDKKAMDELLLNVFYPMNHNFLVNHNDAHHGNYWANWDLCNIACMMSIGIFTDRADIYNEALSYCKNGIGMGSVYNAMPFVYDNGLAQWQESGRDQGHTVFGIGLYSAICEMAWNQGDDLYSLSDNRFLKAAEYVARYNNGYDDLPYTNYERHAGQKGNTEFYSVLSDASRGQIRPIYSMVYNHYVNRMGLSAPNMKEILQPASGQYALEVASGNGDELGWQTLTFANLSGREAKKDIQGPFADGIYRITSVLTGKSLVVNSEGNLASAAKGTRDDEWWKLENLGDGEYIITNTVTKQVMQVNGDYYTRKAVIGTGARTDALNQKFAFAENGTGDYRIISSASTHVVDLLDGGTADDTTVIQWKYLQGTGQKWILEAGSANNEYANLDAKVAEAKAIGIGNYELDSFMNLQTVIGEAEVMLADMTANASEVSAKVTQLSNAIKALKQATNLVDLSKVSVTLSNKGAGANAQEAGIGNIFDGNLDTLVDVRNVTDSGTSGWGGYIIFDMGEGSEVILDKVAMAARNDQYCTRLKGTVIQGSNNGTDWTDITATATGNRGWQKVAVTNNTTAYRYLKVFNAGNWYGNIAELRVYGTTKVNTPEVLANFTFDDANSGFTNGFGVATGSYSLQNHGNGKAVYLNGTSDYLQVATKYGTSLLQGAKELTISFQANPESKTTNWLFYAAPNANSQTYLKEKYLGILDANRALTVERYNNTSSRPAVASAEARESGWYYVTVVYTGNETILYVDGVEVARQSSSYALSDILGENSILYIGKANWGNGEYYKGLIDNYKIVGRAMSAEEIRQEALNYVETPEVLAEFNFDQNGTGFTNGYAVATGSYSLQSHDNGNAVYLNGTSDYLQVQTNLGVNLLKGLNEITVSFQVKPEAKNANWLFYAAPSANAQSYLHEKYLGVMETASGELNVERYNNSGSRAAMVKAASGTTDWHNVTIVYSGTETILYLNGTEVARQTSQYKLTDILGDNSVVYIGKANWGSGEYFKGLIDNYKIYSRALTADEVKAQ